jgi:putative transposase
MIVAVLGAVVVLVIYHMVIGRVAQARASLGRYLAFYNGKRPHSSLGARTPDQAYFDHPPLARAA